MESIRLVEASEKVIVWTSSKKIFAIITQEAIGSALPLQKVVTLPARYAVVSSSPYEDVVMPGAFKAVAACSAPLVAVISTRLLSERGHQREDR